MYDIFQDNISSPKVKERLHESEARVSLLDLYLSRDVRKTDFCICENKDTDQLRGDREADQRLCFRHLDSTIPLLSKSKISSL